MNDTWFIPTTWWLRSALGGGLLLLAVWGLTKLTRQPARRQRLSEWGVLAALLAALLSAGPAWLPLRLNLLPEPGTAARLAEGEPMAPSSSTLTTPGSEAEENANRPTWADPPPALLLSQEDAEGQSATPSVAPTPEPGFAQTFAWAVVSSWFSPDRLAVGLMTAYFLGAVLLIGRWLLGWMALHRFLRSCTPAPEHVAERFAEMARLLRRPPRLLISEGLRVPVSCGVWRPAVVLPAHLVLPDHSSRLRWVFAHELTHLERRDPWSCLLFGLAQGVYFYCPWFWWLRRQVRLCQEFIADAAAARQAGLAEDYAQFLVSLAEAPAGPRVAIGVLGHRSDLFRRITMLLQNPLRIETGCPRRWSLVTAAGLLALAVCASGIGLRAADSEPDKPAPRAQAPAQPAEPANKVETRRIVVVTQEDEDKPRVVVVGNSDDLKELRKALDKLPPGPEMDKLKKDILKRIEDLKANRPGANVGFMRVGRATSAGRGNTRLGVTISQLPPALVEQLDLSKGKGLLINHVLPDHAAAKAGFKDNDILMELDGNTVSSDVREFIRMMNDIKAGTPVDAVVIRKGKEKGVKGITLPEGKDEIRRLTPAIQAAPNALPVGPGGVPGAPGARPFPGRPATVPVPGLPAPAARAVPPLPPNPALPGGPAAPAFGGFGGNNMVMTSIFRTDDRFTGRHQEGSLIITVTGTVTDGKAKVKEIYVQDGKNPEKYDRLSKVPERYRDKAENLIEMTEKGTIKVETRSGTRRKARSDNDQS